MTLVDLPGTYSLTTASEETSLDEQIACHFILSDEPDLLINVVDASNLERNLYLTLQLRELGVPCIIALNMLDIAEKKHIRIDTSALEKQLGCPVVTLVSNRGHGIKALKDAIARFQHDDRPLHVDYPRSVEQAISTLAAQIPEAIPQQQQRWLSLQCLDGDIYCRNLIGTIMQDPTLLSGAETLAL
ncbi:MAG: Fe(2+) transporter FeoB [Candidatus Erwinia impunctatus]|nr:Fe(2+) transporter FeoB [Culicoides impunctatus]